MKTSGNPGRWLLLEGSFILAPSVHNPEVVVDAESGSTVSLAELLRRFAYDPAETRTGQIRLTIEAAP